MDKRKAYGPSKIITRKQVTGLIPQRPNDSHKGMFGNVVIIGGADGMIGAPLLAARAALKLGAGCVHVGLLAGNAPSVDTAQPELMLHSAATAIRLPQTNVIASGCGMGTSLKAHKLLHDAIASPAALILDADALNILALRPDLSTLVAARSAATLLTPHPGEASRLLACETKDIQQNREPAAIELSVRYHASVVLKGANSVIATQDGRLYLNQTGNPGMSTAGMGDVLTGMVAALIAQGIQTDDALIAAVYLHGAAGDELAKQHAKIGMTASELTDWARWLYNTMAEA